MIRAALTGRRLLAVAAVASIAGVGVAAATLLPVDDEPQESPWAGSAPVETAPLVVALCHGSNQSWPVNLDASYFEAQFTETDGSSTVADYWRDISHGRFSIEGSIVVDVQLAMSRDEIGDRDDDDWQKCRDGLNEQHDIDWDRYDGPVVIKPQTFGRTIDAIDETDTEIRVRAEDHSVAADWPAPPFTAVLTTTGSLWPSGSTVFENVEVTAVEIGDDLTTTFTVERGQFGGYRDRASAPTAFPADTRIRDVSEVAGSTGQLSISAHMAPSVMNHELGHFFGWPHSRKLSSASSQYGDCFDIMSAMSCENTHYFDMSAAYAGRDVEMTHGLGMTSAYLDRRDWIDSERRDTFTCATGTYQLRALGLDGSGLHQLRVPVTTAIGSETDSRYLTVELRSHRFAWDRGIPADAVVLHLLGDDGVAYLVDDDAAGGTSGMVAGDRHEMGGWIVEVGDINTGDGTAEVFLTAPEFVECGVTGGTADSPTTTTTTETTTTSSEPPPTTTEAGALEGAACVPGTWVMDSQAFVDSLAEASGAPGAEMQHAGGPYTITINEDGTYNARREGWRLRFPSPEGNFDVIFDADESGTSTWDDDGTMTVVASATTSVLDVTVEISLDGVVQMLPMSALPGPLLAQVPEPELLSGSGTYTCEGDLLQVLADDISVTTIWNRSG